MLQMLIEAKVAELTDGFDDTTAAPASSGTDRSDHKVVDSGRAPISVRGHVMMQALRDTKLFGGLLSLRRSTSHGCDQLARHLNRCGA